MIFILFITNLIYFTQSCDILYCDTCSEGMCFQCQPGFILFNGNCFGQPCLSPFCASCHYNLKQCQQCSSMYQLKNGSCQISTYIIVAPTIVVCIGFALCLTYCIMRIHRKKQMRKALQELYNQQKNASIPVPNPTSDQILENPNFFFQYQEQKGFCSICLQSHGNLITQCGHYFHVDCFSTWIRRHKICPICNNKNIQYVIVVLCMKCKKKYYHYETYINFALQVKVDSDRQCTSCVRHLKKKENVNQMIDSLQMIAVPKQQKNQNNELKD